MNLIKELRAAGQDMRDDGMEVTAEVAYESAACMLEDPKVLAAAKKQWPGRNRQQLQEIMADFF